MSLPTLSQPREVITVEDPDALSQSERRVLQMLADHDKIEDIAAVLGRRPNTVKKHIENACRKLGVHSRHRLLAEAFRRGLIQ